MSRDLKILIGGAIVFIGLPLIIMLAGDIKQKRGLDNCIEQAIQEYKSRWNKHCYRLDRKKECYLPVYAAKDYVERLQKEKNFCLERYK